MDSNKLERNPIVVSAKVIRRERVKPNSFRTKTKIFKQISHSRLSMCSRKNPKSLQRPTENSISVNKASLDSKASQTIQYKRKPDRVFCSVNLAETMKNSDQSGRLSELIQNYKKTAQGDLKIMSAVEARLKINRGIN